MKYVAVILLLGVSVLCRAQGEPVIPFDEAYKRVYKITKISGEKPVIDGKLDEDLWVNQGVWSEPFVQVSPYERAATNSPTYVKLFYDDKNIYVGIRCKDAEPEKMNRFIGNRDENNTGDLISIAFDTYHDFRAAPEFNLNLGGNKTDLIVTDKREANKSWNAVWDARTYISMEDSCWTAELSIPFSQLRYNQISDGIWGLHVRRIIRRNNETQNWSLIPLKNNGHVFSFGELHGMDELPKPREIEILPYVMGKYQNAPKVEGSPYQKGSSWDGNVGFDAKFGLSDYTLDVTVNPDFGQVELDPSVMNLTDFETFYDEKRPFFLEGKHILDFDNGSDKMFYTRRIGAMPSYSLSGIDNVNNFAESPSNVPIIGALKLTGTNKNGLTIGLVESLTASSSLDVTRGGDPKMREMVEPLTNYAVGRVQKNWKGNILLGGMLTAVNRKLEYDHLKDRLVENAYTAGIDYTQYFANRLYYVEAKGMYSYLEGSESAITLLQKNSAHYYQRLSAESYLGVDPNRTSLSGTSGYFKVGRKGNAKWTFSEKFFWSSPGFDLNTIGYMKETDYYGNETEVAFQQTTPWKIFRSNTLTFIQMNKWNYGGQATSSTISANWKSMLWNRFEIDLKSIYGWTCITRKLRGGPDLRISPYVVTTLNLNTDKAQPVVLTFNYVWDWNANKVNSFHTFKPGMTVRAGNHLLLSGEFYYDLRPEDMQYVTTIPGATSNIPFEKATYVMGHIDQHTYGVTLKAQMNVTPDFSIQFYGSPYTSTGKYKEFKVITNSLARDYTDRFHAFTSNEISFADNMYSVDQGGQQYKFKNPDFSFNEFRSNLVARWEYKPGSTLYLVWEHTMSNRDNYVLSGWGDNIDRMFGLPATNVFMVKLNYWFNL